MENLRLALKQVPIEKSIKHVAQVVEGNDFFLLFQRYNSNEKGYKQGLIHYREYELIHNQILNAWLSQIDDFDDNEISKIASLLGLDLSVDDIEAQFIRASFNLMEWRSHFEKLPNSHIERPEVNQLFAWIKEDLGKNEKNIALLVGTPGSGKSVIFKDLLLKLEASQIPFLGIKADNYCSENIQELTQKLNMNKSIETLVDSLIYKKGKTVVLIDQIDALSQNLSARREYLDTFTQLVLRLSSISNVRIVISCRIYDLENDHQFDFYRKQRTFTVSKLEVEAVKKVVEDIAQKPLNLSDGLLELLRTPLHLDVFCKIYRDDLAFEKIKVLRDLYDGLWSQKIIKPKSLHAKNIDSQKCKTLIFQMACTIYENYQNLVAPINPLNEDYPNELSYLISEGIVIKLKEGISFFHQTFYDFAFAKQFTEQGDSIESYLNQNLQGLHIRACLKMMIEFLRERNPKEYNRLSHTILASQDYFFHIKLLLLSIIGYVKTPKPTEYKLVKEVVFPNFSLLKLFIGTVNSREWFLFLLEYEQLERFIEEGKEEGLNGSLDSIERDKYSGRMGVLRDLLGRHLEECPNEVLNFLLNLPKNNFSVWFVQTLLHQLKVWDNPLAFKLFDAYANESNNELYFGDFMQKAAKGNLEWSLVHIRKAMSKHIKQKESLYKTDLEFEYNFAKLLRGMIKDYPEQIFEILIEAKKHDAFNIESSDLEDEEIITDSSLNIRKRGESSKLFELLIDCIQELAQKESPLFALIFEENYKSKSATVLFLLVEGLRANVITYKETSFQFIKSFIERKGYNFTDKLSWCIRQLLKSSFVIFSAEQKQIITELIEKIDSEYERRRLRDRMDSKYIGFSQFKWLLCISESYFDEIPQLKEQYYEMRKRFPEFDDRKPYQIPNENDDVYLEVLKDDMTIEEWYESFIKFSSNEVKNIRDRYQITDHAQQFEKKVKTRPDFFYPLIEKLVDDIFCSKDYLRHGLSGLKEAKYSPIKLLGLLKRIDISNWEGNNACLLVHLYGYFFNEKFKDDFIPHFLCETAINHHDPQDEKLKVRVNNDYEKSIFPSGFNSTRGKAVYLLPFCYDYTEHKEKLFSTLEHVVKHDILAIRCQMMPHLAWLMYLDRTRTLDLFLQLTELNEPAVMEHSTSAAQYLARHDFQRMTPYFQKSFAHEALHRNIGAILAGSWIFEKQENAITILNHLIEQSPKAKDGVINFISYNICNEQGEPLEKSVTLFARFLNESDEQTIDTYDSAFRHLNVTDFSHIKSVLKMYAQSVIARKNPNSLYEYLKKCALIYPEDVLDLLVNFSEYERPNISSHRYYEKEPFEVVINVYNQLWGKKIKNEGLIKKSLYIFDTMLLDDRFRRDAYKVLDEIVQ